MKSSTTDLSHRLIHIIPFGILLCANSSIAAQSPEWQLGAGLGAFNFRLYPGASNSNTYVLPLPYFTYSSKLLEIDRGIRALMPSDSNWQLDLSADFGLPVNSTDSEARRGMPNLDAIVQIGPSLEYTFNANKTDAQQLRIEFPLRTAISVDIEQQANQGWIFEPRLVYEKNRIGRAGLFVNAKIGVRYATQDYHAYYYDVAPAYTTLQRATFNSESGYSGLVMDLRGTWRKNDVLFWGLLRYQNLNHAVIEHSPLVEDKNYFFFSIGISWILATSL